MNPTYIIIQTGRRGDDFMFQIATLDDPRDEYYPVYEVKSLDNKGYRVKLSTVPTSLDECKRRLRVLHERMRP